MGGIVIKTIVWPAPTQSKPAAKIHIVLGSFSWILLISNYDQKSLLIRPVFNYILVVTS